MCACTSLLANCHRTIIWCINYHRIWVLLGDGTTILNRIMWASKSRMDSKSGLAWIKLKNIPHVLRYTCKFIQVTSFLAILTSNRRTLQGNQI
jgi:hypothetical protein